MPQENQYLKPEFTNIIIWQMSVDLTAKIYQVNKNLPISETYNIEQQIKRASCSVSANIAEGLGRYYFKDKIRFYYQARGSIYEVQNFLYVAERLGYLDSIVVEDLVNRYEHLGAMLKKFIRKVGNNV